MLESRVPVESFPPEKNLTELVRLIPKARYCILYYRRFTHTYLFIYCPQFFEHIARSHLEIYGGYTLHLGSIYIIHLHIIIGVRPGCDIFVIGGKYVSCDGDGLVNFHVFRTESKTVRRKTMLL